MTGRADPIDAGHASLEKSRVLPRFARVLPDVSGLDKPFDYSIPEALAPHVAVGTMVRVDLHGRRIGGWVIDLLDAPGVATDDVKPITKVTGYGPSSELIALAEWASVRWAARRIRPFLVAASPKRAIRAVPLTHRRARQMSPSSPATTEVLAAGGGVLRLPPRADVLPSILSAVNVGPTLVVVPTQSAAVLLVSRLRRAGATVAYVPDDWAAAAGGVDVVVGTRSAAWMPCAGLAAAIVVDEHDEALQEERTPTWHARDVIAERCRRAGIPAIFVSPVPTLIAVEELAGPSGPRHPSIDRERRSWPTVEIVDRTDEDPWKKSMVTSQLIDRIRDPRQRVLCISNTTGRARVLACRSCRALLRCERCDAAVGLSDDGRLTCRRCFEERPSVCQACGASRFANLRPGVTRLAEELSAAANREVVVVTGSDDGPPAQSDLFVGTEAALYRVGSVDVVAFLEFDSEMLAPRFRASEQALALIVRAGRLAPTVMIQTFNPTHEVLRAAVASNPAIVIDVERQRRAMLALPPFGALALVSGTSSGAVVDQLDRNVITVGRDGDDRYLVRAADWLSLGVAINATERPPGTRIRVEVDPPRV
jgi:primosomal protein N' (replication factor Y) (superfamily II helicase)